ncbi:MAG: FAD-binding protein [Candidatus Korobacteraceae bacterium]
MDKRPIECDVLVAGGGVAGLMAAIAAADGGAKVVVAEKANSKRSGSGATGNDHFRCYIPEVHGDDMDFALKAHNESQVGGQLDRDLSIVFMKESFLRVKDWDNWGIPMRPNGTWEFTGHAIPGRAKLHLKYAGEHQKLVLTSEALKRGVTILNKVPITEVVTNVQGEVIGAIGISVAEDTPEMKVFRAKSVILATGNTSRLYPPRTAAWMFNTANCPSCAGTGRNAAYKAGAKLVNIDMPYTHAGPKYFARCGKGTWAGILKDHSGQPVAPFATKPTRDGDVAGDIWKGVFPAKSKAGQVVYMDCSETSEEDLQYMFWGLRHEGDTSLVEAMEADGINLRQHMIEFQEYEPILFGRGIEINERSETSVPGLYAAGDETGNVGGGIAQACVFGHIAGHHAAVRAAKVSLERAEESPLVEQKRTFYSQMLERQVGASWQEANVAVQCLMNDYAGIEVRSEILFQTGLEYIGRLKKTACGRMKCGNSHELMRCLETLDLIDLGELVMLAANERKETRGKHVRVDYPYTNLLYDNKFITIRKVDGKPLVEWRDRT